VPSLIIRESTERQELIECGASILTGTRYDTMIESFNLMQKRVNLWTPPKDYLCKNVSDIVINILLGECNI
jgi:UDP-N-acetylglucosamine 2-epimerase